ncbi:Alpha/Beta hydrolase protein [Peziza echinospora]|nr:Alpha/Beta hydrolase protein [Peziza echinospora]
MQILQDRLPGTPGVPLQQPEVLEVIKYMAEYAAASYCENPSSVAQAQLSSANAQAAQALTCLEDYCPTLTKNGVTTHFTFEGKHTYDTTGIVTLDRKRNLIVLSFRGSKSLRNFFTDARIALTPTEGICTAIGTVSQECKAHTGFLKASLVELDGISAALDALYAQHPTFKVVTVGHSLGGAIAILTAAMLRERGKYGSIDIYTYGSPRVGNDALNRHISRTEKGRVYRTTFMDDPIPRLPPVGLGYSHVEPEYHVWRGVVEAGRMGRVEVADVKVFGGTVNRLGNMSGTKGPLGFDVMAHGRYFAGSSGWVSGCGRGLIEF